MCCVFLCGHLSSGDTVYGTAASGVYGVLKVAESKTRAQIGQGRGQPGNAQNRPQNNGNPRGS
jgi:hypothetical protein